MSPQGGPINGFSATCVRLQHAQSQCGHAEASTDENPVSHFGARAAKRSAVWDKARHDHVRRDMAGNDRGVASDDSDGKSPREGKKSIEEAFQPRPLGVSRNGQ